MPFVRESGAERAAAGVQRAATIKIRRKWGQQGPLVRGGTVRLWYSSAHGYDRADRRFHDPDAAHRGQ